MPTAPAVAEAPAESVATGSRASDAIRAVRVWPSTGYTRVTFESTRALKHEIQVLANPDRLVVDIEGADPAQLAIDATRFANDPHVRGVRTGQFKPNVARLVFDLRAEVKPQLFSLKPIADYGHRLVLDIYPAVQPDPMIALLPRPGAPPAASPVEPRSADTDKPAVQPAPEQAIESAARAQTKSSGRAKRDNDPLARTVIVVIDAGHGGEDPGALGRAGTKEKHVTLSISRKLKQLIDAEPNMRAVMTRDGDYFVPLHMRVERARRARGDLFVSIHADAFVHPHARGSSVFALSERGATSSAAGWLARRENDADLIGGVNLDMKDRHLAQTLLDLSQTATINDSLKLGRAVLNEIGGINRLHKPHVEQASFAVLKAPDIPSILVETAFISNPEEEARLADDAYQTRMARSILTGIKRYFEKNPPVSRTTIADGGERRERSPVRATRLN